MHYNDNVIGSDFPSNKAIRPGLLKYKEWYENYKLPDYYGPANTAPTNQPEPKPQPNPEEASSFRRKWLSGILGD